MLAERSPSASRCQRPLPALFPSHWLPRRDRCLTLVRCDIEGSLVESESGPVASSVKVHQNGWAQMLRAQQTGTDVGNFAARWRMWTAWRTTTSNLTSWARTASATRMRCRCTRASTTSSRSSAARTSTASVSFPLSVPLVTQPGPVVPGIGVLGLRHMVDACSAAHAWRRQFAGGHSLRAQHCPGWGCVI